MLDLAADIGSGGTVLQTCLVVDGVEVPVDTDFRVWLRFGRELDAHAIADPRVLLDPASAPAGWVAAAVSFYADEQELPRSRGGAGARALDYDMDAPLIVAAFMQAYGIDLTDERLRMHWHLFLALLRAIPQDTLLARAMGHRAWTAADGRKKQETYMAEMRAAWALPSMGAEGARAAVEYQRQWFGDVSYEGSE